jgi:hypothetical protein
MVQSGGGYTLEMWQRLPADGNRYELVDGHWEGCSSESRSFARHLRPIRALKRRLGATRVLKDASPFRAHHRPSRPFKARISGTALGRTPYNAPRWCPTAISSAADASVMFFQKCAS